jgi:hypothetical protein
VADGLVVATKEAVLTAWVPVEEKRVGGHELTWGEGDEEVLKRASHALPSADDEPTLCAEALPFVPLSPAVGCWWEPGEGSTDAGFE